MEFKRNHTYQGHCLSILKQLPEKSIHCCGTSTPYYGLRSYVMTRSLPNREDVESWGQEEATFQNNLKNDPNIRFIPYPAVSNKNQTQWTCDIHIQCLWDANPTCDHEWETHTRKGIHGGTASEKVGIKDKENYSDTADTKSTKCIKCGAWWGELGQEPNPDLFVEHLCQIFDEVWRVLVDWGTLWINIDDSYAGSGGAGGDYNDGGLKEGQPKYYPPKTEIKNKSLMAIPARLQLAMIKRGWICRSVPIWHKPNPMPESCTDRFTNDYEFIYLFTKQGKYYFKQQQEVIQELNRWGGETMSKGKSKTEAYRQSVLGSQVGATSLLREGRSIIPNKIIKEKTADEIGASATSGLRMKNKPQYAHYRNMRAVWPIATEPHPEAHFATFPSELVKRFIESGCPMYICSKCGLPKVWKAEKITLPSPPIGGTKHHGEPGFEVYSSNETMQVATGKGSWEASCECKENFLPGIFLDPFMGSGTSGKIANELVRDYMGIELNPQYMEIIKAKTETLAKVKRLDTFVEFVKSINIEEMRPS
jgi:DNA modification methylase